MNKAVSLACRSTLAVGLTLLATEIYPNSVAVRGLLCASLVSGLPTFRRVLMRQRFLLIWAGAGVGMLSETLFRDAPWFFLPCYFGLLCLLFFIGSKSRDAATMVIIVYGLSGSLDNKFLDSGNEPIFDGLYRALWCSIGLMTASLAFLIFPDPESPASPNPRPISQPVSFPSRDVIFLGFCATVAVSVGVVAVQYVASAFLVMVTLVWSISLCTMKDKSSLPGNFLMGIAGALLAIAFASMISSSTNNVMIFLSAFLAVFWFINWLKVAVPSLAPFLQFFLILFITAGAMSPKPIQSFDATLTNIYSILGGIVLATILWSIDQFLRSVELAVMRIGEKEVAL
jgi:hypothetical protein